MKAVVAVVALCLCGVVQARTKSHVVLRFVTLVQTSASGTPQSAPVPTAENWAFASGDVKPHKSKDRSDDPFRTPLFRNAVPLH